MTSSICHIIVELGLAFHFPKKKLGLSLVGFLTFLGLLSCHLI